LRPGELPAEKAATLFKPYAASQMKAAQVSTLVNSPAIDSPDCLKPL
jgi:putative SOS response-associated peptidase YedK